MDDKFYKSIMNGIAEIEAIKTDYEEKQSDGLILEVCNNMINPMKRAVARGLYPSKVEELKYLVSVMIAAQKQNNVLTATAMAEQIIYEIFVN